MITTLRAAAMPAAAAAAAIALLAACGGSSPLTIHGTLEVSDFSNSGSGCLFRSDSGYSDIAPGTQDTVSAPDGTVIGSGALGQPKSHVQGVVCTFPFTITDVQGGEPRYGIAVSHRGTVWFTPDKVEHAGLSLGN